MKKHLGFLLNVAAIGLFIPGIILPIFSLKMDIIAKMSGSSLSSEIVDKQLSILGTVEELWLDERLLVAILIFLFSVCIPILKTSLATIAYFIKNTLIAKRIINFINIIGKWSMADVFVVAIFLAIMSTNHADTQNLQQLVIFGFKLDLMISSATLSSVGEGFYYFTGYCILSIIASQLLKSAIDQT
jgi:uncharacterized paraquat-inducible protein A